MSPQNSALSSLLIDSVPKKVSKSILEDNDRSLGSAEIEYLIFNFSDQWTSLCFEEFIDGTKFIYNIAKAIGMDTKIIVFDLANYKSKSSGNWIKNYLWESVNSMEPLVWWNGPSSFSTHFVLAISILSAPITSAATERSFSTYGNIHSKKKNNKLTCDRAGKITFAIIGSYLIIINQNIIYQDWFMLHLLYYSSRKMKEMIMSITKNITENECENIEDEESSGDENFMIPHTDEETFAGLNMNLK